MTDDYWDSVMMNSRDKKLGIDGIKLWNIVYPQLEDYKQCSIVVKEITKLGVIDTDEIQRLIKLWINCEKLERNLEQAKNVF